LGTSFFRSSSSQPRIVAFHGPNAGDSRSGTLRGGGVDEPIAWRTVRRCTPYSSANDRIDAPWRRSLRIFSNSSTLDISLPCSVTLNSHGT